jgi:hypothetical protein
MSTYTGDCKHSAMRSYTLTYTYLLATVTVYILNFKHFFSRFKSGEFIDNFFV